LQKFNVLNVVGFFGQKVKSQQQQNKKSEHKYRCQNRESNPEPLAPQSGGLPLGHRFNRTYIYNRLQSSYNCFNAMGQNINKHSHICGAHFFNKVFFRNILICTDNYDVALNTGVNLGNVTDVVKT